MKKLFLLSIAISSYGLAFSQNGNVGIGTTTPNADAKLDITATNKGLLLPRVALTSTANAAPLSAHVAGMTVYNTKDTLDVSKGTYFNNGIKWIKIGDAATAWSLTGNAGTTPGTNYLGTKDSTALVFKTNATNDTSRKMTILPNGFVGIGTSNPKTILHTFDGVPTSTLHPWRTGIMAEGEDGFAPSARLGARMSGISDAPILMLYRSRGTSALPTSVIANDIIGSINAFGYNGTDWQSGGNASIQFLAEKDLNLTQREAFIVFNTTSTGNTAQSEKMRITANGNVGIGTSTPLAKLHIDGAADNPAIGIPTAAQQANDVIVTNTGRIGVRTINPTANVEVVGNIAFSNNATGIKAYFNYFDSDEPVNYDREFGLSSDAATANDVSRTSIFISPSAAGQFIGLGRIQLGGKFVEVNGGVIIGTSGAAAPTEKLEVMGKVKAANVIFTGIPTYASDAAAGTGGLVTGEMYKTAAGDLKIKL